MFAMILVDVPVRTRPRPSDPPNTFAGTPVSLTNCETQQRRLCRRFSVFIRKMLSFHESLFRSCPHRRPKSHPIGIPKIFDKVFDDGPLSMFLGVTGLVLNLGISNLVLLEDLESQKHREDQSFIFV